jgi:hypothetical protein
MFLLITPYSSNQFIQFLDQNPFFALKDNGST